VARHYGALNAGAVEDSDDVGGELLDPVAVVRLRRIAVTALGHGERADGRRKVREHGLERAPRVAQAMQQDDRHAVRVASLDDRQAHVSTFRRRGGARGRGMVKRARLRPATVAL
jgi:hypothetical protein